jgi:hypothetical protein
MKKRRTILSVKLAALIAAAAAASWVTPQASGQTLVEDNGAAFDAPGSVNDIGGATLNPGPLQSALPGVGGIGVLQGPTLTPIPGDSTLTDPAFANFSFGPTFGALQIPSLPGVSSFNSFDTFSIPGQFSNGLSTVSASDFDADFQLQDTGNFGLGLPGIGTSGVSGLGFAAPQSIGAFDVDTGSNSDLFGSTIDFSTLGLVTDTVFQNLNTDSNALSRTPSVYTLYEDELESLEADVFGPSDIPRFEIRPNYKATPEEFARALGIESNRNLGAAHPGAIAPQSSVITPPGIRDAQSFDNVLELGASPRERRVDPQSDLPSPMRRQAPGSPGADSIEDPSETDRVIQEVDQFLQSVQQNSQRIDNPNLPWDTGGAAGLDGGWGAPGQTGSAARANRNANVEGLDATLPGFIPYETPNPNDNAPVTAPNIAAIPTDTIPSGDDMYHRMRESVKWVHSIRRQQQAVAESGASPPTITSTATDAINYVRATDQHPIGSFASGGTNPSDMFVRSAEKLLKNGEYQKALAHYEVAAVADSENALIYLGQGHAYAATGEFFSAVRKLTKGIDLFPEIAYFKLDLTQFVDARTLDIRRADLENRLAENDDYRFRFVLGYLEYFTGLESYGIANLRKAAESAQPDSTIARFPDILLQGLSLRQNPEQPDHDAAP